MVLSIDPGLNHIGVALWTEEGVLVRAWLARSHLRPSDPIGARWIAVSRAVGSGRISRLVVERPQVYHHSPGDPNDLIDLAGVLGCLVHIFDTDVTMYRPRQWNGGRKKATVRGVAEAALTEEEHARVELPRARSLSHNVWDAVGIGLHHFGRL